MTLSLAATRDISGFLRANLINAHYGMWLLHEHSDNDFPDPDMETAAMTQTFSAGNEVLRELGRADEHDELIITLEDSYHLMRSVEGVPEVFMHVVLDRKSTNLPDARLRMAAISRDVSHEFAA